MRRSRSTPNKSAMAGRAAPGEVADLAREHLAVYADGNWQYPKLTGLIAVHFPGREKHAI
jgi:hypothetical protein